ncbi:MAG: phosphoribosylformylglycinamidine cyclo-ligase [Symbiobacteriia bacterium]
MSSQEPGARRPLTYREAGVDIAAGDEAVRRIIAHTRRTNRPGVLGDIGGFGGLFALEPGRYREPVLVSGTDGVGTKLKIAFMLDKHDTVGQDLVAMCANDVVVQGAEPLFFLDYLAVAELRPDKVEQIVAGVADGCQLAGCALIGGETAELPGFYAPGEYDLAGFCVGVGERAELLDGSAVRPGDAVIGLASSGLHSNGYSLARRVLLEAAGLSLEERVPELGRTLGEEMLEPTRIYVKAALALKQSGGVGAIAHITGGGLTENIPRVLPAGCRVRVAAGSWPEPPIFSLIRRHGRVPDEEMRRTFNLGLGMVLVAAADRADDLLQQAALLGEHAYLVGEVVAGEKGVAWA